MAPLPSRCSLFSQRDEYSYLRQTVKCCTYEMGQNESYRTQAMLRFIVTWETNMKRVCQCWSHFNRWESWGKKRVWWPDHKEREKNSAGCEKRNGNRKQRARFNFQRINLGNTYNSGGCECKDFLLSAKGIN